MYYFLRCAATCIHALPRHTLHPWMVRRYVHPCTPAAYPPSLEVKKNGAEGPHHKGRIVQQLDSVRPSICCERIYLRALRQIQLRRKPSNRVWRKVYWFAYLFLYGIEQILIKYRRNTEGNYLKVKAGFHLGWRIDTFPHTFPAAFLINLSQQPFMLKQFRGAGLNNRQQRTLCIETADGVG